jgi:hypothetical protein
VTGHGDGVKKPPLMLVCSLVEDRLDTRLARQCQDPPKAESLLGNMLVEILIAAPLTQTSSDPSRIGYPSWDPTCRPSAAAHLVVDLGAPAQKHQLDPGLHRIGCQRLASTCCSPAPGVAAEAQPWSQPKTERVLPPGDCGLARAGAAEAPHSDQSRNSCAAVARRGSSRLPGSAWASG